MDQMVSFSSRLKSLCNVRSTLWQTEHVVIHLFKQILSVTFWTLNNSRCERCAHLFIFIFEVALTFIYNFLTFDKNAFHLLMILPLQRRY